MGGINNSIAINGAKAWVNFDGTTGNIRSSFNVSSITKNAAGDYTVNFTNPMPNANYSVAVMGTVVGGGGNSHAITGFQNIAPTTSSFRFVQLNNVFSGADALYMSAVVF